MKGVQVAKIRGQQLGGHGTVEPSTRQNVRRDSREEIQSTGENWRVPINGKIGNRGDYDAIMGRFL